MHLKNHPSPTRLFHSSVHCFPPGSQSLGAMPSGLAAGAVHLHPFLHLFNRLHDEQAKTCLTGTDGNHVVLVPRRKQPLGAAFHLRQNIILELTTFSNQFASSIAFLYTGNADSEPCPRLKYFDERVDSSLLTHQKTIID